MLKFVVDAGVPGLVFFTMVVVGTGLTPDDFRRVARRPVAVVAATVGQVVALPLIGWLLVRCLAPQPAVARGVLLVAACPSGAMANVYASVGRADVALSVTLTAVSCLAAVVTTPLALAFLQAQDGPSAGLSVPYGVLAGQLLVLLLLPVIGGVVIRRRWPGFTNRYRRVLLGCGVAVLLTLLGLVIAQETERLVGSLGEIAAAAAAFTLLAFAAGWATGWAGGGAAAERLTAALVFVVRNVGVATAIAVTTLGRVEFATFATAYFLTQTPILIAVVVVFRRVRGAEVNHLTGTDRS